MFRYPVIELVTYAPVLNIAPACYSARIANVKIDKADRNEGQRFSILLDSARREVRLIERVSTCRPSSGPVYNADTIKRFPWRGREKVVVGRDDLASVVLGQERFASFVHRTRHVRSEIFDTRVYIRPFSMDALFPVARSSTPSLSLLS